MLLQLRVVVILHQLLYFLSDAPHQVVPGRIWADGRMVAQSLGSFHLCDSLSWLLQLGFCGTPFKIHMTAKSRERVKLLAVFVDLSAETQNNGNDTCLILMSKSFYEKKRCLVTNTKWPNIITVSASGPTGKSNTLTDPPMKPNMNKNLWYLHIDYPD